MAIKTAIQTAIQNRLTGRSGLLTWAEHEEMLMQEPTSILESIYPSIIKETAGVGSITSGDSNFFKYNVEIVKIGRVVTITGNSLTQGGRGQGSVIFNIIGAEFLQETTLSGFAMNISACNSNRELIVLRFVNNMLFLADYSPNNEFIYFNFTYNVEN